MKKIITVGSATLDLFFKSGDWPETKNRQRLSLAHGGKYVAREFNQSIGGGGCNGAVGLARQGFPVYCWAKIDRGWAGNLVLKTLKREKVKTDLIDRGSKQITTAAILLDKGGERTIIMHRAENDRLAFTHRVRKTIRRCQWFYFADLALCPKKEKLSWLKFSRQRGVKNFVALSGNEYKKGLDYLDEYFALSDIFILNAHELADIWGGDAPDLDLKQTNYGQKLKLPLLIVTYDIHGSYAYTPEKIYYQPIFPAKRVDATGAGDAYASGFLGKYIKTNDIQTAMKFATKNAASVISYLTTQKGLLKN